MFFQEFELKTSQFLLQSDFATSIRAIINGFAVLALIHRISRSGPPTMLRYYNGSCGLIAPSWKTTLPSATPARRAPRADDTAHHDDLPKVVGVMTGKPNQPQTDAVLAA